MLQEDSVHDFTKVQCEARWFFGSPLSPFLKVGSINSLSLVFGNLSQPPWPFKDAKNGIARTSARSQHSVCGLLGHRDLCMLSSHKRCLTSPSSTSGLSPPPWTPSLRTEVGIAHLHLCLLSLKQSPLSAMGPCFSLFTLLLLTK